jgi:flagellar biosynthesis/type III secretory pathway chaperone
MMSAAMEGDAQRHALRPGTQVTMAALLDVLDEDVRHLESTLSRLNALRSLLIKREDAALQKLLEEVRGQADAYQANERKREQLRQDLAADLNCTARELTLSKLAGALAGHAVGLALVERQVRLRSLTAQLKREYMQTVLLVRDCIRFNRALLHVFLGSGGRGTTYGATGAAQQEINGTLMSMTF